MISENTIQQVKASLNTYEIVSSFIKMKKNGSDYEALCPFHTEKTSSFKISPAKNIYKCFGCGKSGDGITFLVEHEKMSYADAIRYIANKNKIQVEETAGKKNVVRPQPRLEKVSKEVIEYFEKRGISNNTLLRFGITESVEWMPKAKTTIKTICFNYFKNGELINIKFRGKNKDFLMQKDAELIFYNIDAIKEEDECIIVEGEIDCLTMHECGFYNCVSVPNGASTSKGHQKLEYLDNCWQYFENKTKIILAVDSDEVGLLLREELARRLGIEKCFTVEYPEGCKDVNDVLLKHSIAEVTRVISEAKVLPLEGIIEMYDMFDEIVEWYENGYPQGAKARIENFDELLTFAPGQLTIITGIPTHGKDEFANWIMTSLAKYENWSWGICAFEESPKITVTKLIEKFMGKAFDFRIDKSNRINESEFDRGIGLVDKYFHFINTDDIETSLDGILSKAGQMVKRFGIRGFCLNPWNWVEHSREPWMSETEYVSLALNKIIIFAKKFKVHFFLMAHPTKMGKKDGKKYEVPTLYSINGSANFYNKTYNGITIYRDEQTVDIYVQKVKQSWLGQKGLCQFTFDVYTRQYTAIYGLQPKQKQVFPHTPSKINGSEVPTNNIKQIRLINNDVDEDPDDLPF